MDFARKRAADTPVEGDRGGAVAGGAHRSRRGRVHCSEPYL